MGHLRYEAWPVPGTSPYEVVVRDLQVLSGSGIVPKRPTGNGSIEIPRDTLRADGTKVLDAVAYADPDNPANDVTSLIRVYRPGDTTPIHEWLTEDPVADADDAASVRLSGRNIEAILDHEHVEVWDWDGSAVYQSRFPDHIYGGRNILRNPGLEDGSTSTEIYELWNDQTPAATFTITVEGATTAAIAFDATALQVENAIEATAGVDDCLVTGAGTEADPWIIEYVDPTIIDPDMTVADAGGLTSTLTRTTQGRLVTDPFVASQTLAKGVNFDHGALDAGHPFISTAVVRTGTYSLGFNAKNQFGGVQQTVRVKPGGTYQAGMWAYTTDTAATWRLVARTINEEFIASSTPFAGTALASATWTEFTIDDMVIPDGITEIILRFAYVGTGNPGVVYTDDWYLTEGQPATTPGQILSDLFADAQTDHAPTRAALTYINLDFSAANDTAGLAWTDTTLSMTVKRRQSYLQMMRQFEKLGYQWRLVPTVGTPGEWDLQVYNAGTMGTDYGGADDPAIVIGQGTLPSNITRQRPVANYIMAEGAEGLTSRISSATSIAATGRRAQGVSDRRFTDTDPLTTWATQRLNDYLAEVLAPRVTIAEPNEADIWPRPRDEYDIGDTVDFILTDGATRVERVVEAVSYIDDTDSLRWTVEGGSAAPYIPPKRRTVSGGTSPGPTPFAPGDDRSPVGYASQPDGSQLRMLGDAVSAILSEYRFEEDIETSALPSTFGQGGLPAFTIRVAAASARAETKAAADFICDGTDDDTEIKAAVAVCDALGFGRVVLSEGNFYMGDRDFDMNGFRTTLEGMSRIGTYLLFNTGATFTFWGTVEKLSIYSGDAGAFTIDCSGFMADVEAETNGGLTTFRSAARVVDCLISSNVDLAGDEFTVYDNVEFGGTDTAPLVTVSGSEQRIDNMQIDTSITTGAVLLVSGDENRIRGQIQEFRDDGIEVTGDDNDIDLTMTAVTRVGNTPDGVNISGDRNKVEGLLRHKSGDPMTNGVVLTAAADSNWVCIHQSGNITTAYTDNGTNNDRCAGASEIASATDHGALTGLGDDDHTQYLKDKAAGGAAAEVPTHDHSGAAEAGTVAHADVTGQTADDHHAEAHTVASHSDTTATGAELETLTDGSDAGALHNHDTDTAADIAAHAADPDAHHTEAHTIASHSDTTATGAELETLTDGSDADALHIHGETDAELDFFHGTFLESFDARVSEAAGVVTLDLEQSGGGDLTMRFSTGHFDLDCTPAKTIVLTAGSDSSPTDNYVYIPIATKVLTLSTSGWPATEHIKVAYLLVPSATFVGANGPYINQNWNDHAAGTDGMGHLTHIGERIRYSGANYFSGMDPAGVDDYLTIAASNVELKIGAGVGMQMHKHTIPAVDTSAGDVVLVKNWSGDPYHDITDLFDITAYSDGTAIPNNRWFNLVVWRVLNKSGEYEPTIINLPSDGYVSQALAERDADGYTDYTIPREFNIDASVALLVCRITVQLKTTWGYGSTLDLRGQTPVSAAGSGGAGAITSFADNVFEVYDDADITKLLAFQLSGITTGTTRTLTIPDASGTIELEGHTHLEADVTDLDHAGPIATHAALGDAHHAEAHTIVSHSDTTATGAELETLTDGSNADALHTHAGGASDHGALSGLADDDHTQYFLADGSRAMSGDIDLGANQIWGQVPALGLSATEGRFQVTAAGQPQIIDDDNKLRFEIQSATAGGSILFYDEDGVTPRLEWDDTIGAWDFHDTYLYEVSSVYFTAGAVSTDYFIAGGGVDDVWYLRAVESGVGNRVVIDIRGAAEATNPGDIWINSPSDEAEILHWDESADVLYISKPVNALELDNQGTNPTESDGPDQYPDGWSYNILSGSSWPIATGWIETYVDIGSNRAYQIIRNQISANVPMQFHRYYLTDATWSDWHVAYPCHEGGDSSTVYNISLANTWETAYTLTETAYPSTNFTARIHAQARCWMNDNSNASRLRMRVGISRDGGSTWSYGVPSLADQSAAGDIHPQVSYERTRGSVTGNIVVVIQVQSDNASSYADDFAVDITIAEPT